MKHRALIALALIATFAAACRGAGAPKENASAPAAASGPSAELKARGWEVLRELGHDPDCFGAEAREQIVVFSPRGCRDEYCLEFEGLGSDTLGWCLERVDPTELQRRAVELAYARFRPGDPARPELSALVVLATESADAVEFRFVDRKSAPDASDAPSYVFSKSELGLGGASPAPTPTPTPAAAAPAPAGGVLSRDVALEGIVLGASEEHARARLGAPESDVTGENEPTCETGLGQPYGKTWKYHGLVVNLCQLSGQPRYRVFRWVATGGRWGTPQGLRVGVAGSEVTSKLGAPTAAWADDDGTAVWNYDIRGADALLWFRLRGDVVVELGVEEGWM